MSGTDRRSFLRATLAACLAAATPACSADRRRIEGRLADDAVGLGHLLRQGSAAGAPTESRRVEVLIAGAGVSGLSAAWRLRKEGFEDLEILDLGAAPGGSARGGRTAGLAHPFGAHYLPVPQPHQRALCELLVDLRLARGGTDAYGFLEVDPLDVVRAPAERVFEAGFFEEGLWPGSCARSEDEAERERFETLVDSLHQASLPRPFMLPLAHCTDGLRELDEESAAGFLARHGFRGERMRWFLEYATRDDYGARLEDVSAWAFLHYFLARRSPSTGDGPDYLTWPEGNARLVALLCRGLEGRIRSRSLLLSARGSRDGVEALVFDAATGRRVRIEARRLVMAVPQFVVRHVLADDPVAGARGRFRYAPWVVANVHLEEAPAGRGFAPAWDNVRYQARSLGYVDAGHQLDRLGRDRIWTWYLPVPDADEAAARREILETPWERWRDLVLEDLSYMHPGISEQVRSIDVWRFGHGMVKPVPGFLFGPDRAAAASSQGRVHFAHSDTSGLPLFEEAHWAGCRAAEEVLRGMGRPFETLL